MSSTKKNHPVLIIMAHGSRKTKANNEFETLVNEIAKTEMAYVIVKHCFLELAAPKLSDAIDECLSLGYHQFDLYPLFFNQGNHVTRDIPEQIQQLQQQHPDCTIRQLDYFGEYKQLKDTVTTHIKQLTKQ
jgi:sirohydrochlorin ferrochelatase